MGLLDRILGRNSDAQLAPPVAHVRRFDGASGARRFDSPPFGRINPEVGAAGTLLRGRARHAAVNNPWIVNAVGNMVGAMVGPGIVPTPTHPERAARRRLVRGFNRWAESADLGGRADFWGLQAEIARAMIVDGEALIQIVRTPDGPRLRHLPAELLDESMTRDLGGGASIIQGVEFEGMGRPVAYFIHPERPASVFQTSAPPIRVLAADILHVFRGISAGQARGTSWISAAILAANDLDKTMDGLQVGIQIAALHAAFLIDMNGVGGEPYTGEMASDVMETGIEPGMMKRLPAGMDVKFNTPGQVQQVDAFLKLSLRQLAAALGVPDFMLSGDLSSITYSSIRMGLLPWRQRLEQVQYGTLVPQLLRPVWREYVAWAGLSGQLPGFESDPELFFGAEFLPPRPLQVDPLKDTQATALELELGLTSRRKAAAERGWALEDLNDELQAERSPDNDA